MKSEGEDKRRSQAHVDLTAKNPLPPRLTDFVTAVSARVFEALTVTIDFLDKDPDEWDHELSNQSSKQVMSWIAAINDCIQYKIAGIFRLGRRKHGVLQN